jgi:RNA recognition motif-containing protein
MDTTNAYAPIIKKRRIGESINRSTTSSSTPPSPKFSSPVAASAADCAAANDEQSVTLSRQSENETQQLQQKRQQRQKQQQQQQQQLQQEPSPPPPAALDTPRLYIGGLHPRVTQTHVEKLMMPYGTVQDVRLIVKQQHSTTTATTSTSSNFAFCQYASIAQAQAAMTALNGRLLLGKRLLVRPANNQQQSSSLGFVNRRYEMHRDQQQQQRQQQHQHESGSAAATAAVTAGSDAARHQDKQKEIKKIDSRIEAIKRKLKQPP